MTGGFIGSGVRFAYSVASPHSYKKLEQVLDVTIPKAVRAKIDSTVHGANIFKTSITGLADVSDTVVKMLRDNDSTTSPNQNSLYALVLLGATLWIRVEIPANPDPTVNSFEAYEYQARVGSFEPAAPLADKQTVNANFVFTGTSFERYDPAPSIIG